MADGQQMTPQERITLARIEKPEDLKTVLARENAAYDCLSCRVMGTPPRGRLCSFHSLASAVCILVPDRLID